MLTQISSSQFRRAATFSVGLAALWIVLAFIRSGTTFHLGPFLVAAVFPVVVASDAEESASTQQLMLATIGGLATALLATVILTVAGKITGPSLLPFGGAVTEAVVFSITGAIAGFGFGLLRRSRSPAR